MDIERKLASVRRIAAIEPIDGADNIICVTVDGWKLVSAKTNGFQVGDLILYFEIDAFLPIREEFEWMRDRCYKNTAHLGEGFRVRTIKLRGQVSQGLIVPLSDFYNQGQNGFYEREGGEVLVENMDLTEDLGVKKWEKPETGPGGSKFGPMNTRGDFPSFLRKTDEERAQNCWGGIKNWILYGKPLVTEVTHPMLLVSLDNGENTASNRYFKNGDMWFEKTAIANTPEVVKERRCFEATLKLDGSSITIYHNEGQFGVCSRNQDLKRNPDNAFWKTAIDTGLLGYLAQSGQNIAVQGELVGPGVQGNRENLDVLQMFVFNVFNIEQQRYFTPEERHDWIDNLEFSLRHAPVLVAHLNFEGDEDIDYFLEIADNTKSLNHAIAEGIVFKSHVIDGPSFKIISNKFLLKEKD
jgi:hypothetical protein